MIRLWFLHLFKEIHVETSNTFSRPDQVDQTVDQRPPYGPPKFIDPMLRQLVLGWYSKRLRLAGYSYLRRFTGHSCRYQRAMLDVKPSKDLSAVGPIETLHSYLLKKQTWLRVDCPLTNCWCQIIVSHVHPRMMCSPMIVSHLPSFSYLGLSKLMTSIFTRLFRNTSSLLVQPTIQHQTKLGFLPLIQAHLALVRSNVQ